MTIFPVLSGVLAGAALATLATLLATRPSDTVTLCTGGPPGPRLCVTGSDRAEAITNLRAQFKDTHNASK